MAQNTGPDRFTCFAITIIYVVMGGIWTFCADNLFAILLNQNDPSQHSVALSHWMFVLFSALLLYWMLRVWQVGISHSQQSLYNMNRALRSISECTKAITKIADETRLMQEICRIFVEEGGYRFAWVGFAEHDAQKTLTPVAHWGYEDGFIDTMNASWADCERGRGPAGTTIRTGQTTTFQDFNTNPDYRPWREQALRCGYASGVSLPLRNADGLFGALVIFSEQPHAFDAEEVKRMEELADDLSYGINTIRMNNERKRVLEERMLLAAVIEQASDAILIFDEECRIDYLNPACRQIFAIPDQPGAQLWLHELDSCRLNPLFNFELLKALFSDKEQAGRFQNRSENGSRYEINLRVSPVLNQQGEARKYVAIARDVSNETQLERQLHQAQKLEAIATLAGGIAHDFNNILAIILSNTEMVLEDLPQADLHWKQLDIVRRAGFRGKDLVKQILTLSHPAENERCRLAVGSLVKECLNLLRASLPSTIRIEKRIDKDAGMILADPTQIHQVVMNLCTNAADAMRDVGGTLAVSVSQVQIGQQSAENCPGLKSGDYLCLQVKDDGHGMGAEHLSRIFDPFFTSKEQGKGTGLGLSVVHGIVKGHGGAISVTSEPGVGSEFSIFFPSIRDSSRSSVAAPRAERLAGTERILFVDDEEDYVFGQQRTLEKQGYRVTAGCDSREMLAIFLTRPYDFDLLISDQTMPHLTGDMLAREIMKVRPDLPIIICTGSAPESLGLTRERAQALGIAEILMKPVEKNELCRSIRRLLDENSCATERGDDGRYTYY